MVYAVMLSGLGAYSQTDSTRTEVTEAEDDFFELSLEDLMDIEVTSVSKKAERLQDVAAALYVLTQEDIKNSSATTIHELLREVPGYWGIQDEYNNVTSNMRFSPTANGGAGTVLYLLDGTPIQDLMSSTFSNRNFDIPLDEIDRIEVIKGSGGVIYGANSATGVVNIFTKQVDKYDGLHARVEGAYPGYGNATLRGGGKVNDKLAVSGYGKMRYMEGYSLMPEFEGETVTVPKNDGSGDTTITNQFTDNFEKSVAFTLGFKAKYALNDNTSISLNTHFNTMNKGHYTLYDEPVVVTDGFARNDVKVYKEAAHNRFVGNLRLDRRFNDDHSVFVRLSSNIENDYHKLGGGYEVANNIIDLEIQDNLTLGINDVSFGANVRSVNFNVKGINDPTTINYVDPQANEMLVGFFLQDKIRIIEDKLDLLVGAKGETYTLVNNNVYFSPMAKASYRPTNKLSLWGGFTQSYTTPGFNNTNIDLALFQADNAASFYGAQAFQATYQGALAAGLDPASAAALAGQAAETVGAEAAETYNNGSFRTGVKNGSATSPTRFQTVEAGLKANIHEKFQLEGNFFYSWITDGVAATPDAIQIGVESPTLPGAYGDYFLYGNYIKGTSIGTESLLRYRPKKSLMIEFSHTWLRSEWEYQENDDFDVNSLEDKDRSPEVSAVPGHVFRLRGWYTFAKVYSFSASVIYGTKYSKQDSYQYQDQRYQSLLGGTGTLVGGNSDRGILNLRFERKFADEKLSVYVFGNDVLNNGNIENTGALTNATLSQIGGMYGLGATLKIK